MNPEPATSISLVTGIVAVALALSTSIIRARRRELPCTLIAVTVSALALVTCLGVVPYDAYRPIDALELAGATLLPIVAWRLGASPRPQSAATLLLALLGLVSVIAVLDALGATEVLTGHLTGIGIDHVWGWFPAVPSYCSRPPLIPLLVVACLAGLALTFLSRHNPTRLRFTVVAGLLVLGSFLTRRVTTCVSTPADVTLATVQPGAP